MTPRSKRYLALRRSMKYQESALAMLMPIFKAYNLCIDKMKEIAKPVDKRPLGTRYPSGTAIIGEVGPELIICQSGQFIRTSPKHTLMEFPLGTVIIPESARIYPSPKSFTGELGPGIVKDGLYDVVVENAFTPFAKTTVKKITE